MRILHLYRRFHPDYTGDGIYYTRLIPLLEEHGVGGDILVFETRPSDDRLTTVHDGVVVHYLGRTGERVSTVSLLRWLLRNLGHYDAVHLHSHVDRQFLAYILARLRGRRVLFSCTLNDSPTELLADYRPAYRRLAALLMRSIGTFVVISPHLLRQSLQSTEERRIRFIPQGVALDAPPVTIETRAAARRALGLDPRDFVLLNVGSVCRRKNVAFLVKVLERIEDPRLKLLIVGPLLEDDYAAEIRAAAERLGDRVMLVGFREETRVYYEAADAFVFASTAEGFPNVFLEAMSRNLPIITRFLPGLTDFVVDHGQSGYLAHSLDQFAEAIRSLQANPALAERMGEAGRRFAERNLDMRTVAARYVGLYREAPRAPARTEPAFPDFRLRFANSIRGTPSVIGLREFDMPASEPPVLQVVIDTEADFDWDKGTASDTGRVSSIQGLERGFHVFQRQGIRPALVVDYPVATQPRSADIVRRLAEEGCEVGVHLHAWSTPPQVEPRDDWHSFSGNLGPALERKKLEILSQQVGALLGHQPRIFKAGRYGLGPHTVEALEALGFEIDLSICPAYDYSAMGGPDFSSFTSRPGWFGSTGRLLSLPTTAARLGWLGRHADAVGEILDRGISRRLRINAVTKRFNVYYPVRLSPEGNSLAQMKALTRQLHARGLRIFTLSLHSPTLQVGNTPYAQTLEGMRAVLDRIDGYLTFFRAELGGCFSTPSEIRGRLLRTSMATGPQVPAGVDLSHSACGSALDRSGTGEIRSPLSRSEVVERSGPREGWG
ncbi:glycosyltransferase [Muricoccus radiodurans]|uniref:glycosyltransferase n=1 Tax=Muricoccus radiodurans TaxID=2231721 RepID=UPI003CF17935